MYIVPVTGLLQRWSVSIDAVVHYRDIRTAEEGQNDDALKTSTTGKPADDAPKVEVRNICCVTLILKTECG